MYIDQTTTRRVSSSGFLFRRLAQRLCSLKGKAMFFVSGPSFEIKKYTTLYSYHRVSVFGGVRIYQYVAWVCVISYRRIRPGLLFAALYVQCIYSLLLCRSPLTGLKLVQPRLDFALDALLAFLHASYVKWDICAHRRCIFLGTTFWINRQPALELFEFSVEVLNRGFFSDWP